MSKNIFPHVKTDFNWGIFITFILNDLFWFAIGFCLGGLYTINLIK